MSAAQSGVMLRLAAQANHLHLMLSEGSELPADDRQATLRAAEELAAMTTAAIASMIVRDGEDESGSTIVMNEERGKRFRRALLEAMDANDSLALIGRSFPVGDSNPSPLLTVEGLTTVIDRRLSLLQAMTNCEEHLNESMVQS